MPQINELVFVKTNQIPSAKPFKRSCRIIKCTSIANTKRTSLTKDLVNKFKNYRTTSNRGTLSRTKTQETTKKQVTEEKKDPKEEMATSNIEVMDQDGFQMAKVSKKSGSENIIDARGRAGTSSGIPTSNVFEIFKRPDLQNSGNENPTQQEKKTRIPPIVLQNGIGHYTNLVKNLTALLGHKNFSIAPAGKSGTRVFTTSMDDFNKVKENLVKENLGFHTFSQKEVITKKIIMRAAPRMDLNEVTQEMRDAGIEAKITALKPKSGLDGSTYLVQVPKSQDLKDIKKITGVQNIRVRWDTYSRPQRATQCYNCQDFGHSARNCFKPARCMKCASNHSTRDCPLPKGKVNNVKCCNCGENHTSNYQMCIKHIQYLDFQAQKNLRNQQHRQAAPPSRPVHPSTYRNVSSGMSYAQTAKNSYQPRQASNQQKQEEIKELWQEINELCNYDRTIQLLKELRDELRRHTDLRTRGEILARYEALYNDK